MYIYNIYIPCTLNPNLLTPKLVKGFRFEMYPIGSPARCPPPDHPESSGPDLAGVCPWL